MAIIALACAMTAAPAASNGASVTIKTGFGDTGWVFKPARKRVVKGTVVRWKEATKTRHRVAFYKGPRRGESFALPAGEVRKRRLKKVGVYKYRRTVAGHSSLSNGICTPECAG